MTQQTSSSTPQAVREQAANSGRQVTGTAAEQTREVASEAQRQARNLRDQGVDQLREQARTSQQKAAVNLNSIADQLDRMSEQSDSGMARDLVREVSQRAKKVASWLDSREPGDLADELRDFARRKPGLFLAGAAAAGLLAGRLTRGVAASMSEQSSGGAPQPRTSTETTGTPTETAAHPPTTAYPGESVYPTGAPVPGGYGGQHRAEPS
ncbi:hypothetical protein [Amycolatopsis methanolica]|uniref:DUF3618 domain-containing protein n=1 Tax=Amycolatopsis methanolica 239 TaxID=1068978 RepID=A0A076MIK3_AMYME|nr:hypothetical protein [Amycolatopsis methanolica]AIJ20673.1 hypothetical protein AMETH_0581 [Amycolatopsis methanolica 239]